MSLAAHIKQRAEADTALLRSFSQRATQAAASVAAAALVSAAMAPALADIPDAAPAASFLDDAAIVQTSSEQLFTKATDNMKSKYGITVRFVMVKKLPYQETPDEYAAELASQWALGESDVLFVASPKLARAGVFVGEKASHRLTKEIAESIANETYGVAAGVEQYGSAVLDVSNRLIPVIAGEADPGPPKIDVKDVVQTYKTKKETSTDKKKYITVVVTVLVISFVAPLIQTFWYVRDD